MNKIIGLFFSFFILTVIIPIAQAKTTTRCYQLGSEMRCDTEEKEYHSPLHGVAESLDRMSQRQHEMNIAQMQIAAQSNISEMQRIEQEKNDIIQQQNQHIHDLQANLDKKGDANIKKVPDEELLKKIIEASNRIDEANMIFGWVDNMVQCQVIHGGTYATPAALYDVEFSLKEALSAINRVEGENQFLNQYRNVLLEKVPEMLAAVRIKMDAMQAFARHESVQDDIFINSGTRFELNANAIFDFEGNVAAKEIKEKFPNYYNLFPDDFKLAGDKVELNDINPNVTFGFKTHGSGNKTLVAYVFCDSNATRAGMQPGDEIIKCKDSQPLQGWLNYISECSPKAKAGDNVKLVVKRFGETKTISFKAEDQQKYNEKLNKEYVKVLRK